MIVNNLVPLWFPADVALLVLTCGPSCPSTSEPSVLSFDNIFEDNGTALKSELRSLGVSSDESGYLGFVMHRIDGLWDNWDSVGQCLDVVDAPLSRFVILVGPGKASADVCAAIITKMSHYVWCKSACECVMGID